MLTDATRGSAAAREYLSALADGELDEAEVARTCQQWRVDGELRSSWHAFQLIGDVLRSEDLACRAAHDAAFLSALRARLAAEPVVFAPSSRSPGVRVETPMIAIAGVRQRRWAWMAPSALAAGFVVAAGFVLMPRVTGPATSAAPLLAAGAGAGSTVVPVPSGAVPTGAESHSLAASGQFIRDVRLDRYLSAHKEFAGSSALGVPSGFLRNATAEAADR